MAKVYISSTVLDLKEERDAAIDWLVKEGHEPVHSYVADANPVPRSCRDDIEKCDLYLLLLGHRYGHVPEDDNPDRISITQLEFRYAGDLRLPRIALIRMTVPDISLTDINNPNLYCRVLDFQHEVRKCVRSAEFKDKEELTSALQEAVLRALDRDAHFSRDLDIPNPYPGLYPFTLENHHNFFGRKEETNRIIQHMERSRLISITGRSGTGKSSLVAAGLVPALQHMKGTLSYIRFTPQTNPIQHFSEALDRELPRGHSTLVVPRKERIQELINKDPAIAVDKYLVRLTSPILLFADQFEELFTQTIPNNPEHSRTFRDLLTILLQLPNLYLVLTLRSEFTGQLIDWLGSRLYQDSLVLLDPIEDESLLYTIISKPAEQVGVHMERELTFKLIADAKATRGALPLIALTLSELFDHRDPEKGITLKIYEDKIGGIERIIETKGADIENNYIQGRSEFRHACDRLFAQLVTANELKAARHTAEVGPLRADAHIGYIIEVLRSKGFISDLDDKHIELAHETLLTQWPRLRDWCSLYLDKLALRERVMQAATLWHEIRVREVTEGLSESRRSNILRWTWEQQREALEALLTLNSIQAKIDPDFADNGIHAWRALDDTLEEPLHGFLYPEPLHLIKELESNKTTHQRRYEIGQRLNKMGDPRCGTGLDKNNLPDIMWVKVSGGKITIEEEKEATYDVSEFLIARYPVTEQQYRVFLRDRYSYQEPRSRDDLTLTGQSSNEVHWDSDNHPAVNVSWHQALAFCRWLNDKLGLIGPDFIRLPTEWEWQWVAQGGNAALLYPWGDWNSSRSNHHQSGIGHTIAVGMYPLGKPKDYPVLDLVGNVQEWCLNEYKEPKHIRLSGDEPSVIRGGSWSSDPRGCRVTERSIYHRGYGDNTIGFRLCRSASIAMITEPLNESPTR